MPSGQKNAEGKLSSPGTRDQALEGAVPMVVGQPPEERGAARGEPAVGIIEKGERNVTWIEASIKPIGELAAPLEPDVVRLEIRSPKDIPGIALACPSCGAPLNVSSEEAESRPRTGKRIPRSSAEVRERRIPLQLKKKGGAVMERFPQWQRSYGSYQNEELRVLTFPTIKEFDRAIGVIDNDPDLKGLPWDTPDGKSLIVPEPAVRLFRDKRFRFKTSKLLSQTDLRPGELAKMRRHFAM